MENIISLIAYYVIFKPCLLLFTKYFSDFSFPFFLFDRSAKKMLPLLLDAIDQPARTGVNADALCLLLNQWQVWSFVLKLSDEDLKQISCSGLRRALGLIEDLVSKIHQKSVAVGALQKLKGVGPKNEDNPTADELEAVLERGTKVASLLGCSKQDPDALGNVVQALQGCIQTAHQSLNQQNRLVSFINTCGKVAENADVKIPGLQQLHKKIKDRVENALAMSVREHQRNDLACWGEGLEWLITASNGLARGESVVSLYLMKLWESELRQWAIRGFDRDFVEPGKTGKARGQAAERHTATMGRQDEANVVGACACLNKYAATKYARIFRSLSQQHFGNVMVADIVHMVGGLSPEVVEREVRIAESFLTSLSIPPAASQLLAVCSNLENKRQEIANVKQVANMVGCDVPSSLEKFAEISSNTMCKAIDLHFALSPEIYPILSEFTQEMKEVVDALAAAEAVFNFFAMPEMAAMDFRSLDDVVDEEYGESTLNVKALDAFVQTQSALRPLFDKTGRSTKHNLEWLTQQLKEIVQDNQLLSANLSECAHHLPLIQDRINGVGRQTEKTRDIVRAALSGGHVLVQQELSGQQSAVLVGRNAAGDRYREQKLVDLTNHSRLLLKKATGGQEVIEGSRNDEERQELEAFINVVDRMREISDLLRHLQMAGHVGYKEAKKESGELELKRINQVLQYVDREKQELNSALREWNQHLDEMRDCHFYLNFFWSRQLWILEKIAVTPLLDLSTADKTAAVAMLSFINPRLASQQTLEKLCPKQKAPVEERLLLPTVGRSFDEQLGQNPWNLCSQLQIKAEVSRESSVIQGQLLLAVLDADSPKLLSTILSVYYNSVQLFPAPSQVLFCDKDTELQEALLFLSRCLRAARIGIHNALFCLVLPEQLPDSVRFAFVHQLQEIMADPNRPKIRLAMICMRSVSGQNYLIDQFYGFCHSRIPVPNDELISEAFRRQFPNYRTLTSDGPGLGKTERARDLAAEAGKRLVTLSVSGPLTRALFVDSLRSLPLSKNHALHLDVGYVSDFKLLDILIFELLVLGTVSAGATIYRLPVQHVFLEIANTLGNKLQDSLRVASWFPAESLQWEDFDNFHVSGELLSPVQVVCNYLDAFSRCSVETRDLIFWPPQCTVQPLPVEQCRRLLADFLVGSDLNFSLLHSWINVLSDQLLKLSASSFFRVAQLQGMVGESQAATVRKLLVEMLLSSSRDYATRSVVSSRDSQKDASSLATGAKALRELASCDHSVSVEEIVGRVKGMIKWDETNHFLVLFNSSHAQTITILYRRLEEVSAKARSSIERLMKLQGYVLSTQKDTPLLNFQNLSQDELLELLCRIARPPNLPKLEAQNNGYALTTDNLLKMALIIQRVRANVPVIIMGETGCGENVSGALPGACQWNPRAVPLFFCPRWSQSSRY